MFRCDKCNKVSEPREGQNPIVVEKRQKTYVNKIKRSRFEEEQIIESTGWEIAREIKVCNKCFEKHLEEQNGTTQK